MCGESLWKLEMVSWGCEERRRSEGLAYAMIVQTFATEMAFVMELAAL